jgi:hypothetical protein
MIHDGHRLSLGLEALDYGFVVHSGFDQLQSDMAAHWRDLICEPDLAHAAFTKLAENLKTLREDLSWLQVTGRANSFPAEFAGRGRGLEEAEPSEHICYAGQVEGGMTTPSSLGVVMYVTPGQAGAQPGTVGYCGWGTGTYELARYTDGPTVTPLTLNIPGGTTHLSALENDIGFTALYQTSGQLGGIVLWDASTGNLDFYSDATFTRSTTLLSDVSVPVACVNVGAISNGNINGGSRLLANVTTSPVSAAYQITASGGAPQQFFAVTQPAA